MEEEEEPSLPEVIKRVFLAGVQPFDYMVNVSSSPDVLGPIVCLILLSLLNIAYYWNFYTHVYVSFTLAGTRPINVNITDNSIIAYLNGTRADFSDAQKLPEDVFSYTYSDSIILSITHWMAAALSLYVSSKLIGGRIRNLLALAGYSLSARIYEYFTKFLITLYLVDGRKIYLQVPRNANVRAIQVLLDTAISKAGNIATLMKAHGAFFGIWMIVVMAAVLGVDERISMRRAVVGAVIAYILTTLMFSIVTRLLLIAG